MALVVGCVELKTAALEVRLRDIRARGTVGLGDRFTRWAGMLRDVPANRRIPVRDLYRGVAWSAVRGIDAGRADLDIWVVSAGLGLVPLHLSAPAYGATFSLGMPDSVGASRDDGRRWWRLQTERPPFGASRSGARSLRELAKRYSSVVIALSASYFYATRDDVLDAMDCGGELAIVSVGANSARFAGDQALRLPAGARTIVGGTLVSLLNRSLFEAVADVPEGKLNSRVVRKRLEEISNLSPALVPRLRKPMTDTEVLRFVSKLRASECRISASVALARLRAQGFACEQQRFRRIFGSRASA